MSANRIDDIIWAMDKNLLKTVHISYLYSFTIGERGWIILPTVLFAVKNQYLVQLTNICEFDYSQNSCKSTFANKHIIIECLPISAISLHFAYKFIFRQSSNFTSWLDCPIEEFQRKNYSLHFYWNHNSVKNGFQMAQRGCAMCTV